jgi:DNA-binding PadR family transcriptional regulator
MFHKFAYQTSGENWNENWTPPWKRGHGWHRPHGILQFARHGRGFGPRGFGGGPGGPGGRFFERGDMKFALLELLRERSMYGYEMIKALEEKSGGFYTPSPGSIYPTLQLLEERSLVNAAEQDGKRVYSITDAGRALLDERQQQDQFTGPPWMRHRHGEHGRGPRPELQALRAEAMEVARLFAIAGRNAWNDPTQLTQLRSLIERTRKDLTTLIYGEAPAPSTPPQSPPEEPKQ